MNANFGNHIVRMYGDYDKMRKLASLVIAIDPKKLGNPVFAKTMAKMVTELHAVKPLLVSKSVSAERSANALQRKMPTGRYSGSGRNIPLSGRELITIFYYNDRKALYLSFLLY